MLTTQQCNLKYTQAINLFYIIQQSIQSPQYNLTSKSLHQFFKNQLQYHYPIFKDPYLINKDIHQRNFAQYLIKNYPQQSLSGDFLKDCDKILKYILSGIRFQFDKYTKRLRERFPLDILGEDQLLKLQQQIQKRLFYVKQNSQVMNLLNSLNIINDCFSSIIHKIEFINLSIKAYCQVYIKGGLITNIISSLKENNHADKCFQCLLFIGQLYQQVSYQEAIIFQEIYHKSYWPLYLHYFLATITASEIKNFSFFATCFIFQYCIKSPQFCHYLLEEILKFSQPNLFCQILKINEQNQLVLLLIDIYTFLVRQLKKLSSSISNKVQSFIKIIQKLALALLQSEMYVDCSPFLKLISETIKFDYGYRDISIYNQSNIYLYNAIIGIFENALKYDNQEIIWMFVKNNRFLPFVFQTLTADRILHCQYLQLIYLMSKKSQLIIILQEKYSVLQHLGFISTNNFLNTFISKIMEEMSQNRRKNPIVDNICHSPNFYIILKNLISIVIQQDGFYNIQILVNVLKILYNINKNTNNSHIQYDKLSLKALHDIFQKLIWNMNKIKTNRQQYFQFLLKIDIPIQIKQKQKLYKLYKLCFIACQGLILKHFSIKTQEDKAIYQNVFNLRNDLLSMYYCFLTKQQLQFQGIPLIIQYNFKFLIRRQMQITRYLPLKMNYESFRVYCFNMVQQISQKEEFKEIITSITFRDLKNNEIVQDQASFKNIIKYHTKHQINQMVIALQIIFDYNIPIQNLSIANVPIRRGFSPRVIQTHSPARNKNLTHSYVNRNTTSPSFRNASRSPNFKRQ